MGGLEALLVHVALERVEQRLGADLGALGEGRAAEVARQTERADVEALLERGQHRLPHRGDAGEAVDQDKRFHKEHLARIEVSGENLPCERTRKVHLLPEATNGP